MKRTSVARLASMTAAMIVAAAALHPGVATRRVRAVTVLTVTNTNDGGIGSQRGVKEFKELTAETQRTLRLRREDFIYSHLLRAPSIVPVPAKPSTLSS